MNRDHDGAVEVMILQPEDYEELKNYVRLVKKSQNPPTFISGTHTILLVYEMS